MVGYGTSRAAKASIGLAFGFVGDRSVERAERLWLLVPAMVVCFDGFVCVVP